MHSYKPILQSFFLTECFLEVRECQVSVRSSWWGPSHSRVRLFTLITTVWLLAPPRTRGHGLIFLGYKLNTTLTRKLGYSVEYFDQNKIFWANQYCHFWDIRVHASQYFSGHFKPLKLGPGMDFCQALAPNPESQNPLGLSPTKAQ